MQRILPNQYHGVRQFLPENATEQVVVNQLDQKGYQVALYLAGRNVNGLPSLSTILPLYRYAVQGPAFITRVRNPEELPQPDALIGESRAALAAFEKRQGYDIQKGGWTIALRPLRATNEACVQCHNAAGARVKMNDALGAAMYVYKRT